MIFQIFQHHCGVVLGGVGCNGLCEFAPVKGVAFCGCYFFERPRMVGQAGEFTDFGCTAACSKSCLKTIEFLIALYGMFPEDP